MWLDPKTGKVYVAFFVLLLYKKGGYFDIKPNPNMSTLTLTIDRYFLIIFQHRHCPRRYKCQISWMHESEWFKRTLPMKSLAS